MLDGVVLRAKGQLARAEQIQELLGDLLHEH